MVFLLLVIFQLKHFLADYPLQGKYMLGKFAPGKAWILPLAAHAGVHFLFTFFIVLLFKDDLNLALLLGLLDFGLHFVMDRVKASPNLLGKFKNFSSNEYNFIKMGYKPPFLFFEAGFDMKKGKQIPVEYTAKLIKLNEESANEIFKSNKYFWWALGLDQMVHHLTDILIIYIMVL